MEPVEEPPKIDQEGYATCPDCGMRVNCGTVGISNLTKRHRGTKKCLELKARRDKKGKGMTQGSLFAFMKPKPMMVPPMVEGTSLIQSNAISASFSNSTPLPKWESKERGDDEGAASALVESEPINGRSQFVTKLEGLIRRLPASIPEGTENDTLAPFGDDPRNQDVPNIEGDELWEENLNRFLKEVLGWGTENQMDSIIRRGKKGMDGVLEFTRYFVEERGVSEGLFEGKLSGLLEVLERIVLTSQPEKPQRSTAIQQKIILGPNPRRSSESMTAIIIDVDSEVVETAAREIIQLSGSLHAKCQGYILKFPSGKTPYSAYPFALHDSRSLPWDLRISSGVMTLFARNCLGSPNGAEMSCPPCLYLPKNKSLEGIINRLDNGVHVNSPYAYHGTGGLQEVLHRQSDTIAFLQLRGLNQTRALLGKATALSDYKRLVMAIASGQVSRVSRVIHIALEQKKGVNGIISTLQDAANGYYRPNSYSEEEDMWGLLTWRLAGNRVAHINHRSGHGPSVTYLRSRTIVPPLIPSPGMPKASEVQQNVMASLASVLELTKTRVHHSVLMFDEIAMEKRLRWDPKTNYFLGFCREHAHNTSMEFVNEGDLEEAFRSLDDEEVHYAPEATIGALGILCEDNKIYPGRAILASGDCKRESGLEHASVVQTTLDGVNASRESTKLRVVSLASDGETRRGTSFALLTFKNKLSPDSPIYPILSPLRFMDFHVGDDDLTCDKDWKHIFKRFRNLLLRPRGVVVNGLRITPDIIRMHFKSNRLSGDHIRSLFNPDDQQDVKLAFEMLKDIWTLPDASDGNGPGFKAARKALSILGKFFYHLVFPFLCVDLSLSEQLEHLSAAAHLTLALFKLATGKSFIPTNLYLDVMHMIKNVFFCVAKAKMDDPDGSFWIILLGTDRLEELFGILGTMVGSDSNLDMLSLVSRLSGCAEVSNILAKYPHWDCAPRRLNLPTLSRDSTQLPDRSDHIKPAAWRGDVRVKNVSLQTSWRRGMRLIEEECPFLVPILKEMEKDPNIDIFSPFGSLLVNIPLGDDDEDESQEDLVTPEVQPEDRAENPHAINADIQVEVEESMSQLTQDSEASERLAISPTVLIKGKEVSKARALAQFSKYRKIASSTDRLKRVQQQARYTTSLNPDLPQHSQSEQLVLAISDPIASLLSSDNRIWLCVGEVNGLKIDGKLAEYIPHEMLPEKVVTVSYQLLGLRPATTLDDTDMQHDWRSYAIPERSFTVPGRLVQAINPTISTQTLSQPYYLFQSSFLVALTANLMGYLSVADLKGIQKILPTDSFPYREVSGKACFVGENNQESVDVATFNATDCPACGPDSTLDLSQGQRLLEHIAAHILYDSNIERSVERCGLCLRSSQCQFYLKKGRGAQSNLKIDWDRSTCPTKLKFSYSVAAQSTTSSPCSNIPILCPLCSDKKDPAIWKYYAKTHFHSNHPTADFARYEYLWKLSNFEVGEMKKIWMKRLDTPVKRPRKSKIPPLIISDAHRGRIPSNVNPSILNEMDLSSQPSSPDHDSKSESDADSDIYMPYSSGHVEVEQLSVVREEFNYPAVREDSGERNNGDANVCVGSTDEHACDRDSQVNLTSSDATGTPIPEEIAPSLGLLQTDAALINEMDNDSSAGGASPEVPSSSRLAVTSLMAHPTENTRNETSLRPKRKIFVVLNQCLCGETANPASGIVLECKQTGCETRWYHLACVELDQAPRKWVCDACASSRGKVARR